MSPRKPTKTLSETEKNKLIEEYRNTSISQRDVAEKYEVSKTQVQKIFEQNNVMKLVRPVKKRKEKNNDSSEAGEDQSPNSVKEFTSVGEMARFAVESPDKNVSKELFAGSRGKCLNYRARKNMFQTENI